MKESCENCAECRGRFICERCPNHVAVKSDGWCSDWKLRTEKKSPWEKAKDDIWVWPQIRDSKIVSEGQSKIIKEQEARINKIIEINLRRAHTIESHEKKIREQEAKIDEQGRIILACRNRMQELKEQLDSCKGKLVEMQHLPNGKYSWPPIEFKGRYLVYSGPDIYEISYEHGKIVMARIKFRNA